MQKPYNSVETVPEGKFNNVDQNTKSILRNNEDKVNFKRTQTTDPDPPPQTSTQSTSGEKQKQGQQKPVAHATSSSSISQKLDNAAKRCFRWCTQCCRKQDRKRVAEVSSSKLLKSLKERREKCRSKKRRKGDPSKQSGASTAEYSDSREIRGKKRKRDGEKAAKFDDSRQSRKKRKEHASEASVVETPTINDEKLVASHALGKDFDFTKSCCYLCATNAMALAAAMGKVDKFNMSIQASIHFEEKATSVKNDGLPRRVRTVQSSVKVRTRDMSTLYPEQKKPKKPKTKLKLKNLNIFPKAKVPKYPKVRHVACGTDKTMRSNNVTPQCRAGRGTHCVRGDK